MIGPALRALATMLVLALPADAQTGMEEEGPHLSARIVPAPGLAEASPGLAGFLADEAAATLELFRGIAAEDAEAAATEGYPFRRHSLEIRDELRFLSAEYVSVLRRIESYTGGAHGSLVLEPVTVDRATGMMLRLDAFLGGPGGSDALIDIARQLARRIAEMAHGGDPDEAWARNIRAATRPDLAVLQNFTLVAGEDGRIAAFAFHFAPYEVAPFSAGPIEITVPAELFRGGLKPGLAPRFAR